MNDFKLVTWLVCVLVASSWATDECDEEWMQLNGKLYLPVKKAKTWNEAQDYCNARDAYLASIVSASDTENLIQIVPDLGADIHSFWTGGMRCKDSWTFPGKTMPLSYEPSKCHFSYTTCKDAYKNWQQGEPNGESKNEHCIEAYASLKWNDIPCSSTRYFICQG